MLEDRKKETIIKFFKTIPKELKRRAYGIVDGIRLFQRICLDLNIRTLSK